jgi:hypothetical protein
LSGADLDAIRGGLAAGRKPRVQFTESAGQIAGQVGQVVQLTDPAVTDEWVVVRFGRDELPFAPADLRVAPRGAPARKAPAPPAPVGPARVEPEFVIDKPLPVKAAPVKAAPVKAAPAARAVGAGPATGNGVAAAPVPRGDDEAGASAPREGGDDVAAPAPRKTAARPAKAKAPAALTVTLAYGEGEWTVAAAQGAKVLAKPYVIRPAEALRMVSLVDVPGVQEAVEQILSTERAEAEQQARRLRAELAEIEARLADLGEAG